MSISKFGTTTSKPSALSKVIGIENKVSKSGDIMYGDLNLNGHSIKNLANPEEESDGVNKGFLDSNFIRFEDNIPSNSKLAIIGDGKIATSSPIQVQGRDLIGVNSIKPFSNDDIYVTLGDELYLRGVASPSLPSDAVNKQYVDDHFSGDLNLNNNRITGLAEPIDDHDAATKIFVPQPAYDAYKAFCNSVSGEIQLTHLGGKNNLCTLRNNSEIGLTDISSGNLLRISISGSAINNTSGNLSVKLVELPSREILERFPIRRSPIERPQRRTFNATILVQPTLTRNKFACEYSTATGEEAYFEFNVIFLFELIKFV